MTYYTKGRGAERTFSTLRFASVRERERRDCIVAKTIYFNITKLLRPGNIEINRFCYYTVSSFSFSYKQSEVSKTCVRRLSPSCNMS